MAYKPLLRIILSLNFDCLACCNSGFCLCGEKKLASEIEYNKREQNKHPFLTLFVFTIVPIMHKRPDNVLYELELDKL